MGYSTAVVDETTIPITNPPFFKDIHECYITGLASEMGLTATRVGSHVPPCYKVSQPRKVLPTKILEFTLKINHEGKVSDIGRRFQELKCADSEELKELGKRYLDRLSSYLSDQFIPE